MKPWIWITGAIAIGLGIFLGIKTAGLTVNVNFPPEEKPGMKGIPRASLTYPAMSDTFASSLLSRR